MFPECSQGERDFMTEQLTEAQKQLSHNKFKEQAERQDLQRKVQDLEGRLGGGGGAALSAKGSKGGGRDRGRGSPAGGSPRAGPAAVPAGGQLEVEKVVETVMEEGGDQIEPDYSEVSEASWFPLGCKV
jgi:hypothetical protein